MKLFDQRRTAGRILLLPIDKIVPSPHQPRRCFDEDQIGLLADSIAQNGLLTPISVRAYGDCYVLIAGERRLRACRRLGLSEIPAILLEKDETSAAVLTLIENLHRENLDCFEEAEGILNLMRTAGLTQTRVCELIGKSQSAVANKLRLLRLPDPVRELAQQYGLGERICRSLLRLEKEPERQLAACERICEQDMSTEEAELYVERLLAPRPHRPKPTGILRDSRLIFHPLDKAVRELKRTGLTVNILRSEEGDCLCYTVLVPKSTAQRKKPDHEPAQTG